MKLRRIIIPLIAMAVLIGGTFFLDDTVDRDREHTVIATIFPVYDFARAIGGDDWHVELAVPPGADIHTFALTPKRMQEIKKCGLFFFCGRGIEPWAEKLATDKDAKFFAVNVMDGVKIDGAALPHNNRPHDGDDETECPECTQRTTEIPHTHDGIHFHNHDHGNGLLHAHPHDHSHDDGHGHDADEHGHQHLHAVRGFDPHLWTDPVYAADMALTVASAYVSLDPANADRYRRNADTVLAQLLELDREFRALAAQCKDTTIVFCGHSAFGHFAKRYGFRILRAYTGTTTDEQTSPARLAELVSTVRKGGHPAIFCEEGMEPRLARMVANDLKIDILTLHGGHTVSKAELKAGETWISLMRKNLESLKKGLR